MNRHIVPDQVLERPEPLSEAEALAHVPSAPFAFIRFLVMKHFRGRVFVLVALAGTATSIEAFGPYALSHLINAIGAAVTTGATFSEAILPWMGLLAAIWLGSTIAYRSYEAVDVVTSPRMRALAQKYLFTYLMGHSPRYFQENFAGKLGQKVKQAGQAAVSILQILGFEMVRVAMLLVVGGALMFATHGQYALVLAVWAAVYLSIVVMLAKRCVRLSKAFSNEVSTSTGRLIDAIANADLVRAFAKADYERRFLSHFLADEMNASKRLRSFLILMRTFMSVATLALLLGLVALAGMDALAGAISVGQFAMIYFLANQIIRSVQELSYRMLDYFEQVGTLAEALELVSQRHEIQDVAGARPLAVGSGAIRFEHVHFAHPDGLQVFQDLNLTIAPGEKVGLVGPSGAGKSTLVKLLRRQFEPQAGRILIDGQAIGEVSWDSLNQAIAEVPQMPGVFHRAVRDNIRYAKPGAPEAEVLRAATEAYAHEFIAGRAAGYDTIVGEQGIKLSGGERQRVAIARALVKDARILVLDEATSSLDSESEHLIQEALWTLMQGRTVIAIAHRLSTIAGMDRIVYLEAGRIVEEGPHRELLAKGGAYARLWNRQMGGFIDAA
ncbi:MAG: ABC transporter ATP-binding protein [Alphaproteobacteria bacterium]|nr:ABC transporter ATP-binding protein [Alphaproteobacteria bacterium]